MLKSLALASVVAIGLSSGAQAACGTASLAGNWDVGSLLGACTIKIYTTGAVSGSCSGIPITGKLKQTADCRITGTINGETALGRSEALDAGSTLKPNLMLGSTKGRVGPFAAYRR